MGKGSGFVDLHVHTWYSDSSLSPAEVVREAQAHGVTLLSVADHEGFDGSLEAEPLCRDAGIRLIPSAELECTQAGISYHVLALGAKRTDPALVRLAQENRRRLDEMSEVLVSILAQTDSRVSPEDYRTFPGDRAMGGWRGLQYLLARGVTDTLKAGMPLYERLGIRYVDAGFPGLEAVVRGIHGAGGRAVLAHPGYTLRELTPDALIRAVEALLPLGLDGLECHYPTYDPSVTAALCAFCRANGLMITAGSDCHGAFGHSRVGEMNILEEEIDLGGL